MDTKTLTAKSPAVSKKSKSDILIGALVFVRTRNPYHYLQNNFHATTTATIMAYPNNVNVTPVSTWYTNGTSIPSTTTTDKSVPSNNIVYGRSAPCDSTLLHETFKPNSTVVDNLKELADAYREANGQNTILGGHGTSGDLGMSYLGNPGGFKNIASTAKITSTPNISGHITYTPSAITQNTAHWGLSGVSSGTSTNLGKPAYRASGWKTVSDYFDGGPRVDVMQEDDDSEPTAADMVGVEHYPEFGVPFCGIVVDRFTPNFKTENGEEVCMHDATRLYKVLVDEKNVIWLPEDELTLMKPVSEATENNESNK